MSYVCAELSRLSSEGRRGYAPRSRVLQTRSLLEPRPTAYCQRIELCLCDVNGVVPSQFGAQYMRASPRSCTGLSALQVRSRRYDASRSAAPHRGFGPRLIASEATLLPVRGMGYMARARGFEPRFCGSRPLILPLDDTRITESDTRIELASLAWKARAQPLYQSLMTRWSRLGSNQRIAN
jgi:hypothetical protein